MGASAFKKGWAKLVVLAVLFLGIVKVLNILNIEILYSAEAGQNQCYGHPQKPINCIHCKPLCLCDKNGCRWIWER